MSLFLLNAPLNGCVMDSSEDGVISQGPDRKKETTYGILSGEN